MEVDGKHFAFRDYELKAYNLEVFVAARFQPRKRPFRFWYDGTEAKTTYDDAGEITNFRVVNDCLKLSYVLREREITAARYGVT